MTRALSMMRYPLIVLALIAAPALASAQTRVTTAPLWSGSITCVVDTKGLGYVNHQTHTWTLTGAPPPDGGVLDYPATWTVSGAGSLRPTAAQGLSADWKTQGSAPGVRVAIFVRQSDQRLLVFLRHSQLNAPNGTIGTQQLAAIGPTRGRSQPMNTIASEWRQFPTIQDVPTSTHITGSSVSRFTDRLDYLQPLGSEGQAACTWDLVQSAPASPSLSTAQIARPTTAASGGRATGSIGTPSREAALGTGRGAGAVTSGVSSIPGPRTITLDGFAASGTSATVAPRTITLDGFTAAGASVLVGPRTITLDGFEAVGASVTVAPRTITLDGFTATGTLAVVTPRTITLDGWTATGP
jgi:hypothetical protein